MNTLIRILCIDFLLAVALVLLTATSLLQYTLHEYWLPMMTNVNWLNPQDSSYYGRQCTVKDISTQLTRDLIAETSQDAVSKALRHGSVVVPRLLDAELATDFRNYFIENIQERDGVFDGIIEPEHRATWGLDVWDDPLIPRVLRQVLPRMTNILEQLLGDDPAVVELNHITVSYGAVDQHWHSDTGREVQASAYVRNYAQSYSLFIPLQNTTAAMGATSVCPGTHMCWSGQNLACQEGGFQLFEEDPEGWPLGWGFLYNNAMQHRGSAHIDPEGPDRVLFIMTFTSRPRYGLRELETRFPADHFFSQWWQTGFTTSDYMSPHLSMRQPLRLLRNLGLWKLPSQQWGWDLVTLTIGLAENGDHEEATGNGQLETFLDKYSWMKSLSSVLRGDVDRPVDESAEKLDTAATLSKRQAWITFFTTLFSRWLSAAQKVYAVCLTVCLGSLALSSNRRRAAVHLVGWHAAICSIGFQVVRQIDSSGWGINIRRGALYRVPMPRGVPAPSTLPYETDVLVPGDEFLGSFIGGYQTILDSIHPGNQVWRELVTAHSSGFRGLTADLQQQLCRDLVDWMGQQSGRILMKNTLGDWAFPGYGEARRIARKELMLASSPEVGVLVRGIDYLMSETRYGYWRMVSMSHSTIPNYLRALQDRLIGFSADPVRSAVFSGRYHESQAQPLYYRPRTQRRTLPRERRDRPRPRRSYVPPGKSIEEPFLGAWLQVGDTIEANHLQSNEWYKGELVGVDIDSGTWSVYYQDDDTREDSLCRRCVRPYTALEVGETVFWMVNGEPLECVVVRADPEKEMYAVQRTNGPDHLVNLKRWDLHRQEPHDFVVEVGAFVEVEFDGELSLSMILEIYDDDTVLVVAEDGEEQEVDIEDITFNLSWLGYTLRTDED